MSKRILVVEYQEDLRAILRDFLIASGYTVIEAVDGAAQRSLLRQSLSLRPKLDVKTRADHAHRIRMPMRIVCVVRQILKSCRHCAG